jgi:hypothetical protein
MTTTIALLRFNRAIENYGLDFDDLSPSQRALIDTEIQYDLAESLAYFEGAILEVK